MWSSQLRRSISNALKKQKEKETLDDRVKGQLFHYEARMSRGKENIIFIYWLSASARANSRIDDLDNNNNETNWLTLLKVDSHAGVLRGARSFEAILIGD